MDIKELGNLSPTNFGGKMDKQNIDWKGNSRLVGDEGERINFIFLCSTYLLFQNNKG